jgi:hypothetical protein
LEKDNAGSYVRSTILIATCVIAALPAIMISLWTPRIWGTNYRLRAAWHNGIDIAGVDFLVDPLFAALPSSLAVSPGGPGLITWSLATVVTEYRNTAQ